MLNALLEKIISNNNSRKLKLFWYKVFVNKKLKLFDFFKLSDFVLIFKCCRYFRSHLASDTTSSLNVLKPIIRTKMMSFGFLFTCPCFFHREHPSSRLPSGQPSLTSSTPPGLTIGTELNRNKSYGPLSRIRFIMDIGNMVAACEGLECD